MLSKLYQIGARYIKTMVLTPSPTPTYKVMNTQLISQAVLHVFPELQNQSKVMSVTQVALARNVLSPSHVVTNRKIHIVIGVENITDEVLLLL